MAWPAHGPTGPARGLGLDGAAASYPGRAAELLVDQENKVPGTTMGLCPAVILVQVCGHCLFV